MIDRAFYARRAEQELGLAMRATAPAAVKVHQELAAAYLAMLDSDQPPAVRPPSGKHRPSLARQRSA